MKNYIGCVWIRIELHFNFKLNENRGIIKLNTIS